jgi:hypothetical protein
MTTTVSPLFDELLSYTKELEQNFDSIPEDRKDKLRSLSEYLSGKWNSNQTPKAIIICTHNSRRSHLGQLWLAVGADHYGLPEIETFSGGTEATAFHPNAVNAVRRAGFKIETEDPDAPNPVYQISWMHIKLFQPDLMKLRIRLKNSPPLWCVLKLIKVALLYPEQISDWLFLSMIPKPLTELIFRM